jgi:nicotinamide-nucleotide amidase
MTVELINTGSELMLGRVLNTHQQWLCRRLSDAGYNVVRQVAVADTGEHIQQAVRESLSRADLVITTGGLGPTSDDITRDLIAQLLCKRLHRDKHVLAQIKAAFKARKRSMIDSVLVQTLVPEGALVLPNPNGTAPGLAIEVNPNPFRPDGAASWLIMLPGPPRELRPMFTDGAMPLLRRVLPSRTAFVCRTLRTSGVPESLVQEAIGKRLHKLVKAGLDVGYCARVGQVDVRLSAKGTRAAVLVREAERVVGRRLGENIYGFDDDDVESSIIRLLTKRKRTLSLAESCTGGLLANRITNVSGASAVFLAGLVTYANSEKENQLGVRPESLRTFGAVSKTVCQEMAQGVREKTGSDYAISVTGIAGPSGGTKMKPVGTVFIGFAGPKGSCVERHFNPFDRQTFKEVTTSQALDLLRRQIKQHDFEGR